MSRPGTLSVEASRLEGPLPVWLLSSISLSRISARCSAPSDVVDTEESMLPLDGCEAYESCETRCSAWIAGRKGIAAFGDMGCSGGGETIDAGDWTPDVGGVAMP